MVEITMAGMCEDCTLAQMSLTCLRTYGDERVWTLECEHERACTRAWEKGYEKGRKGDNNGDND